MSTQVSIEVDVDLDIEEYLEDVPYTVLAEHLLNRAPKNSRERHKRRLLIKEIELELEDLIEKIIDVKQLSIIDAMKIKETIETL